MKNIIIIILILLAVWYAWSNFMPKKKPDNAATQYADTLKNSREKAEDAKNTANLVIIRSAIVQFKSEQARYPDSLQELMSKGFIDRVPNGVEYDKNTGEVK